MLLTNAITGNQHLNIANPDGVIQTHFDISYTLHTFGTLILTLDI